MANKQIPNYYEILGISNTATVAEIKTAYRRKCVENHPDKHNGNPEYHELMCLINEAYEVLSDVEMRIAYDRLLGTQNEGDSEAVKVKKWTPTVVREEVSRNYTYASQQTYNKYNSYYNVASDYDQDMYEEFIEWLKSYIISYMGYVVKRHKENNYSKEEKEIIIKVEEYMNNIKNAEEKKYSDLYDSKKIEMHRFR